MRRFRLIKMGTVAAVVGLASGLLSNSPPAHSQTLVSGTIGNNDSLFIDGKTFTVTPGRAKGDTSAQIAALGARDLGPAAIIFRSGEKLYLAAAPLIVPGVRSETVYTATQTDQPNRIAIEYAAPKSADLQQIYNQVTDIHALERMQEILSPFRLPEVLTIKTAECGMMNAWYDRENSKPTVTVCYELLQQILQTLPKGTTPAGVTPVDAAAGQFFWLTTHEVGHAAFDMYRVPIFGHEEDAADQFAAYIMLEFGKERARRLVGGSAWAWKEYIADYRRNPEVQVKLAAFSSNHGQPQERFYNLMCMAYGADPVEFADLTQDGYLPPTRSPNCKYEYNSFAYAFHTVIAPHIDMAMAEKVLNTRWLPKATEPVRLGRK